MLTLMANKHRAPAASSELCVASFSPPSLFSRCTFCNLKAANQSRLPNAPPLCRSQSSPPQPTPLPQHRRPLPPDPVFSIISSSHCFHCLYPFFHLSPSLRHSILHPPLAGVSCLLWHVSQSPDVCCGCRWKIGHDERSRERERGRVVG